MTFAEHLMDIGACLEAQEWAANKTATQAWEECPRADWLVWWAWTDRELGANSLVDLMAATTAGPRMAMQFVPEGENRPLAAIEAAERWAANPTVENRRAAAWASTRAAWAAAGAAGAAGAAWASTRASTRAAGASGAAGAAAWAAAWASTRASGASAGAAAWASTRAAGAASHKKLCAKMREILSQPWKED